MSSPGEFHDDAPRGRFELTIGGETAYADYERETDTLVIRYVYAPPPLRGTGAADRLMQAIASQARAEDRKLLPLCGYAAAWLRAHKSHHDLMAG